MDSKGNVKEFFGSGFGRFRLVSIEYCVPKVTFREFLWQSLSFCRAGSDVLRSLSVVRSKGDVSRVFVAKSFVLQSRFGRFAISFSSAFQR